MAEVSQLHGSCACERNQYTVVIPNASSQLAQVFFDNSVVSRRAQASPVTAWLRIPLDWYQSVTLAQFPDESHSSIKRIFHTPSRTPSLPPTRKAFCGYCGSHLTQWNEVQHVNTARPNDSYLDVTLGSLMNESLDKLEALNILPEQESDNIGPVEEGSINDEDHVPTNEESAGGVDGPDAPLAVSDALQPPHLMSGRGMPFFEEMIDHSRLGRIKRQVGGHTSRDGSTHVQWEVVEIGGATSQPDEPMTGVSGAESGNKRQKLSP